MKGRDRNKAWLNDSHYEFGSVAWHVTPSKRFRSEKGYVSSELRMTDCSDSINLEFSSNDAREAFKRLQKLDTLISELQAFRKTYVDAMETQFKVKLFE